MRTGTWIVGLLGMVGVACASGSTVDTGGEGGGDDGATAGPTWATSTSTATPSTGGTAGGAFAQSWNIVADFTINGLDVQSGIKSAVLLNSVLDGKERASVVVTDVGAFCAATNAQSCGSDPHFALELDLSDVATAGTYDLHEGL